MSESIELLTLGYGRWPAKVRGPRLADALKRARVDLLVDIRHSTCASNLDPAHHYGPRDWHVRPGGAGIVTLLRDAGIDYRWLVELGNPQKTDPEMTVLREHLSDPEGGWPVHRGLAELRGLVVDEGRRCCLLCACEKYEGCHRKVVAEAFRARAGGPAVSLVEVA